MVGRVTPHQGADRALRRCFQAEIDRAASALAETASLSAVVAQSVDDALSHAVSTVDVTDRGGRSMAMLEASGWGLATILRAHPDQRSCLADGTSAALFLSTPQVPTCC